MKIIRKTVKNCNETDWKEVKVLELEYSHMWERWTILIRDYEEEKYDEILKQLRIEVRKAYTNFKTQKAHNKNLVKS